MRVLFFSAWGYENRKRLGTAAIYGMSSIVMNYLIVRFLYLDYNNYYDENSYNSMAENL